MLPRRHAIQQASGSSEVAVNHTIVDKARMLRGVPLLSEVSTEVLADLAALSAVESHPGGAVLFREGEPADAFYLVIEGEVAATRGKTDAFRVGPGEQLGALAVLDERPRAFTATTAVASLTLRIGAEDFLYLLEQHPRLARGVIRYLARQVRSTIDERGRQHSLEGR
jgi:CRP-like cAMP-binding protein